MKEWEGTEEQIGETLEDGEGECEIPIIIYDDYVDKINDNDVVAMERSGKDEVIVARVKLPPDWKDQKNTSTHKNGFVKNGKRAIIKVESNSRQEVDASGKFIDEDWPVGKIPSGEPVRGYGEERLSRGW